jgi:hypothetical protein
MISHTQSTLSVEAHCQVFGCNWQETTVPGDRTEEARFRRSIKKHVEETKHSIVVDRTVQHFYEYYEA